MPSDLSAKNRGARKYHSATPSSIRAVNRAILLNLIRLQAPISRAGLSERTGIFRSNVSEIVDELIESGLVREKRAVPVGRGRVPFHLYLNDAGFRVLGISIRPDKTHAAYAGLGGEIQNSLSFATPKTPRGLMNELRLAIREMRSWIPDASGHLFEQICVSIPGLADAARGRVLWVPALPEYSDFALGEELEKLAGAPVSVDNDNNLAALAEMWLEDKSEMRLDNFVFLEIGDVGVGAGLILNHEIYRGHDSTFAAEFGHMVVDPSGPRCECGRRGCWELFVSNRATWARCTNLEFDAARFEELIQSGLSGDRRVAKAFRETADRLSLGISNIVLALNPEVVVVMGRITKLWHIIRPVVEGVRMRSGIKVCVRPARLQTENAFLQGAVSYAVSKAFAQPNLGW
ncbi:MAG TPA: ROK family transcriptional regulator [Bryobacteraceae bacterium]|nr:ROK family transcriptional regulator [Bryobacteraceae bacterium]